MHTRTGCLVAGDDSGIITRSRSPHPSPDRKTSPAGSVLTSTADLKQYHPSLISGLEQLLQDVQTLAIVCNQFGDTGKGKCVDLFAAVWAEIVARGQGGANAGHTVVIDGVKYDFHMLPSGILHAQVTNVIGEGVAFEPSAALKEMTTLIEKGKWYENIMISKDAHLVLPTHILLDLLRDKSQFGTTGKGIAPVYTDVPAKIGLTVKNILNKDTFREKLRKNIEAKLAIFRSYPLHHVEELLEKEAFQKGRYKYDPIGIVPVITNLLNVRGGRKIFDVDAIVQAYCEEYAGVLKPYIADTTTFMGESVGKKKILLELAQGLLLSHKHGTKPYTTSSDASIDGLAEGVGLRREQVDLVLGIIKGFYMTRVGAGPFTTEMGGSESEKHCERYTREMEVAEYGQPSPLMLNHPNEFTKGIAIRQIGDEYGVTTKRPRRVGWLDLPLLRHAIKINGPNLILTKLDVLDECEQINICKGYTYEGPDTWLDGTRQLRKGDHLDVAIPDANILRYCKPIYETFSGWKRDTTGIRDYADVPGKMKTIIEYVENQTGARGVILSFGPQPEQTVMVKRTT